MSRSRTLLLTAGVALAASAISASAADAASVNAIPLTEVVSEVPFPMAVTGAADTPGLLSVGWAGLHEGCSSPSATDEVLNDLPIGPGPFSLEPLATVEHPGARLLCAFVEEGRGTVAASIVPFSARPPRSDLTISAPPVTALGRPVRIRIAGAAEAPRHVWAKLARPGLACEAALASFVAPRLGLQENTTAFDVNGTFRLDQYGTWTVCAKANRYHGVIDPTDTFAEAPIRVTVRCTAASRELSRARDRWRAMSRRLRLRGLPPSPQLRIRGMAVRRARAWVGEACAPGA